ncbi:coiled-coil domain-containing protein 37-like [Stegastes partitus]|uniref:Coiled-coil domain-containing protein 37-like n=1 Tax=Stegastes partitus TaxID=144197 RepID=A0A9Y4JYR1_9TELE|nr:PREDICTED: coiled-coil domain-containing protein 37-like [Stegastes partitus]
MSLNPSDYGRTLGVHGYEPVPTPDPMASEELLKLTSWFPTGAELYFSDPQQLAAQLSILTDQILSLTENCTPVDETLEADIEIAKEKIKTSEERLKLQVDDMKRKIVMEQERAALFKQKVQLYESMKTQNEDKVSDDLDSMVAELYSSCVDSRPNNLSTIEKLACVEYQMSLLLDEIESIPEDTLKKLRHIQNKEKRSRLREEKQRLEMEKKKEMKERCSRRSLSEAKKITGRQLKPRSFLVKQPIQVTEKTSVRPKEDLHAYLFEEDSD